MSSYSKSKKAIRGFFGLENRGVNPRFSPCSTAVNPFTAIKDADAVEAYMARNAA